MCPENEGVSAAATAPTPNISTYNSNSPFRPVRGANQAHRRIDNAPSPEAVAAARDLAFEAIVDNASLGESHARSLSEAAWRGDRTTVELHIRQWRSCLLATIDAFKALDIAEARAA
jgi:hypothetical protein